jgi:hypothetical protein
MVTKDQIREVFLRNGFTIKEGHTDLKPYVYDAANELATMVAEDICEMLRKSYDESLQKQKDFDNRGSR